MAVNIYIHIFSLASIIVDSIISRKSTN